MGLYPGARKQNQIGAGFIVTQKRRYWWCKRADLTGNISVLFGPTVIKDKITAVNRFNGLPVFSCKHCVPMR